MREFTQILHTTCIVIYTIGNGRETERQRKIDLFKERDGERIIANMMDERSSIREINLIARNNARNGIKGVEGGTRRGSCSRVFETAIRSVLLYVIAIASINPPARLVHTSVR